MNKPFHLLELFLVAVMGFLVVAPPVLAQVSDDFSSLELDPATWSLVDPAGDCSYQVLNGQLAIHLPANSGHDPRSCPNRAARMMQNVTDGDFEIEAKFQSIPTEYYQTQGLLVEMDPTHFLRLDTRWAGSGLKVSCATVNGCVTKIQGEGDLTVQGSVWLRLNRTGNTWRGFHSLDGVIWTEAFVFEHRMTVSSVGVFGGNAGASIEDSDRDPDNPVHDKRIVGEPAPAFDVAVDYFFDTAHPIDPEDGDIQNGMRVDDSLQALYFFSSGAGEVVFDYSTALPKLDLAIADTTTVTWLPGGGLDLTSPTLIASLGPADKIIDACVASDEITLEIWVDPLTTDQEGPARILTVSEGPSNRNATLYHGQWGSLPNTVFGTRLRTTETSLNGQPETVSPAGSLTGDLQHVVYTRDTEGQARVFIDGVERVTESIEGVLDNWDSSYRLGIGAEMDGTRFWLGEIYLAAVYSRALTPRDVEINFGAGPDGGILPESAPVVSLQGLLPGDEFMFTDQVPLNALASDLDGEVVRVEFFAGETLLATDAAPPYAFTWTDPAVGSHQIYAVATDDQGNQTSSEVIPILVSVPASFGSALFISDDFHDEDLGQPWTVTDGTTGAAVDQSDGHVILDLPPVTQDPWTAGAQMVFAHQTESDVDLALELKLATADFQGNSFGGLRFEGHSAEVLQLLGELADGNWVVSWGTSVGGAFGGLGSVAVADVTDGLWLQVRRQAQAWSCWYSTDGYAWQQVASPIRAMTLNRCGWVAGGMNQGAGAQTVAFDYAFNLASPIHPEDGGSGGDITGPAFIDFTVNPSLDHAVLSWQTDEPAFSRVVYGLTTEYEMGLLQGATFLTDHTVDIPGLAPGNHYHFKVTCIDTAGNISTTGDMLAHTDLEIALAPGPGAGDVFRETRRAIYDGDDWRVTDPDALAEGAADFLPNPVLDLEVPDLTGAVRAELIIDRWGGHPGTSNKWIRLNGSSWLYLPELAAIPASNPECYMYEDNLMIGIPLDQLQAGTITLEGTADRQICHSFDWGQWGWFGVVMRVYYDDSVAHPTGSIVSPAAGETIVDAVDVNVSAAAAGTVEEVQVLAYYEGHDTDGDGVFSDWHRTYFRSSSATTISINGIVGSSNTAPHTVNWDVDWIPDQQPGSVKLQARILDDTGMWYVTDFVENLSLQHSDGVVKMYSMDSLPSSFWVRAGQSQTAEFTIPPEDDLATATSARMLVATWNGRDTGRIDINGLWSVSNFGANHFYLLNEFSLPVSSLLAGVNEVTISATTLHHGMEVLWPGPMFFVRYGSGVTGEPVLAGTGDVDGNGKVDLNDSQMVLKHSVGAIRLSPARIAAGDLSGDDRLDPWDAALISDVAAGKTDLPDGTESPTSTVNWGQAQGRYGLLSMPLEMTGRGSIRSLWLEVTAPGIEDLIENVTSGLTSAGAFQWNASGDKLWVAYAGATTAEITGSILEIVMNVAGGKAGGDLQAAVAIDGSQEWELQKTGLASVPVRFALGHNYPNPFNPITRISFDLPVSGQVLLSVFDLRGYEIRTLVSGVTSFGEHTVTWDGRDEQGRSVPSGVYFYRIQAEGFATTRKMMLLK